MLLWGVLYTVSDDACIDHYVRLFCMPSLHEQFHVSKHIVPSCQPQGTQVKHVALISVNKMKITCVCGPLSVPSLPQTLFNFEMSFI